MKRISAILSAFFIFQLSFFTFTSCDDSTDDVGQSLTDYLDQVNVYNDTFIVTTQSLLVDSVLSRNVTGYLGKIRDPETGAYITGNFMTQFNVLEDYMMFPLESDILSRDDNGEAICDSVELRLFCTSYFGDSLATMKVTALEMAKPMEEGVAYYSNFDPEAEGYIREDGIAKNRVYAIYDERVPQEQRDSDNYTTNIQILLNDPYTDKDGNTWNNLGTYFMHMYYDHPEYFHNSYKFIHNVFPGFYVKTKEGLGSMAYVNMSRINCYLTFDNDGDTATTYIPFSGTEEVLQTTTITNDVSTLSELAADNSCTYLKTPAGIFTEMTLPVEDIIAGHENDTLNTAKIVLTRYNNTIQGNYTLDTPGALLMVQKDSLINFFENAEVIDNLTSYLATNNSSSYTLNGSYNYDNTYTFNNISSLVRHMYDIKQSGMAGDEWDKVVLVPVEVTYNSSGSITKIVHDMSMTSTRLVGGPENSLDDIQVTVIYSNFSE